VDDESMAWKLAPDHVQPQDALHAQRATRAGLITTNYNYEVLRHRAGAAERKHQMDTTPEASAPLVLAATEKNSTRGKQVAALERERERKRERERESGRSYKGVGGGGNGRGGEGGAGGGGGGGGGKMEVLELERAEMQALKTELAAAKAKVCVGVSVSVSVCV
jgi:hypothetical protein